MADSMNEKLFSDFAHVTTQQWTDRINIDLKGADFEKKLVWRTNEGFKIHPFYRAENLEGLKTTDALPGEYPYFRGTKKDDNTWYIRQEISVDDPKAANAKALDILNKGIDSIGFKIKGDDVCAETVETLLKDIYAEYVELNFVTCPKHVVELAKLVVAYFVQKGADLTKLAGSVAYDPMEKMITKGKDLSDYVETAKELIEVLSVLPKYRCIMVDGVTLNNAGAYIRQELGYALAWGNEYLHTLTEAGVPVDVVANKIKFNLGISGVYFIELAMFRAARMLWAQIVNEYKPESLDACKIHVHAETSLFNKTLYDAHVNLLRTQTEAMSAAIAGVDSITVVPFNVTYEEADDFSERIARNQQLLLKEECHFDKVVDPAGGSYFIENLTIKIAEQAWQVFLGVEEAGGFMASIKAGTIQEAVKASNKDRHVAVSKRKDILLGTNQYPNFTELAGTKRPAVMNKQGHCGCSCEPAIATLNFDRQASDFETLRLRTEEGGKRPIAFMLTIGNLAMRQARAQFSCNFLATAGYQVIDNLGFKTVEEGVDAALAANADIVVICSSDDEYAEYAIPAFQYLNGRAMFIVAGAPACTPDLQAAGIEYFVNVKVNVLDTMKKFSELLGIK